MLTSQKIIDAINEPSFARLRRDTAHLIRFASA
jgi:hypothetical protein